MKARYRPYNPEEGYFTLIDPKDVKKHNPLLKAIDSFVEEHVSVEPFSQSVKNEAEGAPAVHPRMMLKVIFYSYAKGIYSSREIRPDGVGPQLYLSQRQSEGRPQHHL
jgi:transposase